MFCHRKRAICKPRHLLPQRVRCRALCTIGESLREKRVPVQITVPDSAGAHTLRRERPQEGFNRNTAELVRIIPHVVIGIHAPTAWKHPLRHHIGHIGQPGIQSRTVAVANFVHLIQVVKLLVGDCDAQRVGSVLEAHPGEGKTLRPGLLADFSAFFRAAQHDSPLVHVAVVRREHTALPRRNQLRSLATETADIAYRADLLPLPGGPVGVRTILNHSDPPWARQFHNWLHVRGIAPDVADHDCAGPIRNLPLDVGGIQIHRIAIYIGKDSNTSQSRHRRRCSHKCIGGNNHLIAGTHSRREQGRVKRRRTAGKRQPVFTADVLGELALELADQW